jgi:hypothetical protein
MLHLGKKPAAPKPKDFRWADFAKDVSVPSDVVLPHHPRAFGHGLLYTDWLMLGNGPDNTVRPGFGGAGCCVFSGRGHEVRMVNRVVSGIEVPITGKETISDYSACTGYVLGDDSTDNGTDMGNAAEYSRNIGILDANGDRHKIAAWVRIDPSDYEACIEATYIFLATGVGFLFPAYAWQQWAHGEPWDYDPSGDSTIDGGHYVTRAGSKRVVSWGRALEMTQAFHERQVDEVVAYITEEEMRKSAKDVHGFDLEKLQAYLDRLGTN